MTTLAAPALRHAAVEVIAPYSSVLAGVGFPTIAESRVFADRGATPADLSGAIGAVPVVSIYTPTRIGAERGRSQSSSTADWCIDLHVVTSMAIVDGQSGSIIAAPSTPETEANLDFLGWQIRHLLLGGDHGSLFRKVVKRVCFSLTRSNYSDEKLLALARHELVMTCECDDALQPDAGGLPERIEGLRQMLPVGSPGRAFFDQFAGATAAITRTPLTDIRIGTNANKTPPDTFDDAETKGRVTTPEI